MIRASRWLSLIVLAAVASAALGGSLAVAGVFGGGGCPDCGHKVCHPVPTVKKDPQHCWEVECKDICIPRAKWPWEACCEPTCAKVKTVKVLKKVDYECEKCGYKWEVLSTGCAPCPCGR